jgi:hypothetical protein
MVASALLAIAVSVFAAERGRQDGVPEQQVSSADDARENMPADSPANGSPESDEDC